MLISLFVSLLLASAISRADILYIDMNNSVQELESARKAAEARKEKLIVIPNVSKEAREKLYIWSKQAENLSKAFSRNNCGAQAVCKQRMSPDCKSLSTQIDNAYEEKEKNLVQKLGKDHFHQEIKKIAASKAKITTLGISGHDGGGKFFGDFGQLNLEDFKEIFSDPEVKGLADSVRSLHLWGCYAGTATMMDDNWKKIFPRTELIVGFWGEAPLNQFPGSYELLEDILKNEQELISQKDDKTLHAFAVRLKHFNITQAALCVGDTYITTDPDRRIGKFSAMKSIIPKCAANFPQELHDAYRCYANGESGCSMPRLGEKSRMDQYLSYLRANPDCSKNEFFRRENSDVPNSETVLRLINHETVMNNFTRVHAKEIDMLNKNLSYLGLPEKFHLKVNGKTPRDQLWKWQGDLQHALSDLAKADPAKEEAIKEVAQSVNRMGGVFGMSERCIPEKWLTPGQAASSDCVHVRALTPEIENAHCK